MSEQVPSAIGEAPSLADIAQADDRVGKVDFTAKLGDRMDESGRGGRADDGEQALTSMVRPQRPADAGTGEDDERMPFILPPARVDEAMLAEAERTRAEVAAARGELPDDEDADQPADADATGETPETDDGRSTTATTVTPAGDAGDGDEPGDAGDDATSTRMPRLGKVRPAPAAPATTAPTGAPAALATPAALAAPAEPEEPEPVRPTGPPEGLLIHDVADLDLVAAEAARAEVVESARREFDAASRLEAEAAEASRAAEEALAQAEAIDPSDIDHAISAFEALEEDDDPERAPLRSVAEVASAVIESMRRINDAHERHVAALEVETARRCELLTAQAELDAELIRLHARREAHAIISAARVRSGDPDPELVETDQLGEIGETFSRFAETIETTVVHDPESPDHLRKS